MGKPIDTPEAVEQLTDEELARLEHFIQFAENSSQWITPNWDTLELDPLMGFTVMVQGSNTVFRLKEVA